MCSCECTQSTHMESQLGGLSAITEVISRRQCTASGQQVAGDMWQVACGMQQPAANCCLGTSSSTTTLGQGQVQLTFCNQMSQNKATTTDDDDVPRCPRPTERERKSERGRERDREQGFYPAFEIANYVFGHGQNEPTTVDSQRCGNAAGACLMDDDAQHRVLPATPILRPSPPPLRHPSAFTGRAVCAGRRVLIMQTTCCYSINLDYVCVIQI